LYLVKKIEEGKKNGSVLPANKEPNNYYCNLWVNRAACFWSESGGTQTLLVALTNSFTEVLASSLFSYILGFIKQSPFSQSFSFPLLVSLSHSLHFLMPCLLQHSCFGSVPHIKCLWRVFQCVGAFGKITCNCADGMSMI